MSALPLPPFIQQMNIFPSFDVTKTLLKIIMTGETSLGPIHNLHRKEAYE